MIPVVGSCFEKIATPLPPQSPRQRRSAGAPAPAAGNSAAVSRSADTVTVDAIIVR